MFDRILVPLDGSARSEAILSQVARILKRDRSRVHLVRSVDFRHPLADTDLQVFLMKDRQEAEDYIGSVQDRLVSEGMDAKGRVVEGHPAEAVVKEAKRVKATLIAMSTHGYSGIARWVMGSVTEKVLHSAPVPMLVVPGRSPRR